MSAETQEHEKLCRLLKLKQHEQPHPRYFNDFSAGVLKRIEAGDKGDRTLNWAEKVWEYFAARPGWTGAVATTSCALLIGAMIYAEQGGRSEAPVIATDKPAFTEAILADNQTSLFSTNPVASQSSSIQPGESLFDMMSLGQQRPPVIKVSYPVGGEN